MVPGEPVPGGINNGWVFVASDAHNIAKKVRENYPDARLVFHPNHFEGPDRLGVAEFFRMKHLSKQDAAEIEDALETPVTDQGGFWCISLRPFDPVTRDPLCGEPDDRVLKEMFRISQKRRKDPFSAKRYVDEMERRHRAMEEKQREEQLEHATEFAEAFHYAAVRGKGDHYPKIIVPRGI